MTPEIQLPICCTLQKLTRQPVSKELPETSNSLLLMRSSHSVSSCSIWGCCTRVSLASLSWRWEVVPIHNSGSTCRIIPYSIFRLHNCVQSTVSLNFHSGQGSYAMCSDSCCSYAAPPLTEVQRHSTLNAVTRLTYMRK